MSGAGRKTSWKRRLLKIGVILVVLAIPAVLLAATALVPVLVSLSILLVWSGLGQLLL